ncbi:hypothetical protein LOAG_13771 [Loa loa]|uniref:F-box domain-containing protein n=1 Tax=Loa loa TaxID=7209 RepID=A0A1S0TIX9_LOALO|nr:hypothetical protein LOAG_13771 [Loa loa]EFO14745.2 hypothetical protein LOAG_13771 [Loa loa]
MDAITESPGRYWPVSHKYDTIDRKYKFFKATNAYRMQAYYPLIQLGRASYSYARRDVTSLRSQISIGIEMDIDEFTTDSSVKEETLTTVNDLSDDILLAIFAYCHPIDLIHGFSLVCRRWNYLANYSSLFTEVRVLVDDFSLKYGSVKMFFHRTSQYLRKLCIDCPVPLPSAEVNALFDICFPNVIHLDLGSLKGENFFVGNVIAYSPESDPKLPACNRPLNLLHIYDGMGEIDFSVIRSSPWRSTLTELHLGYYIRNDGIEYIGLLHNLKVFSWGLSLNTLDEEFAHIKNLCNLEELRVIFGGEDCNVSSEGLTVLFTLPDKEPEKSFPYKLKHLVIGKFYGIDGDLLQTIDRNCPNLRTLGLPHSEYSASGDEVMPSIISNFKHLMFLDLSSLGECYKDEVWNNLNDDDLPDLRLLKLHGNKVNIENLQRLNLRRPKLLISTRVNHFINWTETENGCVFHDTFYGDIRAVENDLRQIDGLRNFVTKPELCIYDNLSFYTLTRSSSVEFRHDGRIRPFYGDSL